MKTASKKIATVGAAVGIVAALLALSGALTPVLAATQQIGRTTTGASTPSTTASAVPSLSVGQVITINSTQGHYFVVGDRAENGTASGTVTLTVTGKFASGYSVSLTAGSLSINGTAYAISSGSAEVGPYAHHLVGQGTTTTVGTTLGGATSGAFLVRATARGTFGGEYATMSLDLQSGATEYAISLVGSI